MFLVESVSRRGFLASASPYGECVQSVDGYLLPRSAPAAAWECDYSVVPILGCGSRSWWSFGVELEGGWDRQLAFWKWGGEWARDGSVTAEGEVHTGEVRSPVFRRLEDLLYWVRWAYPDQVNASCGLHVHFRGSWSMVSGLFRQEAQREFLRRLRAWGESWGVRSERFFKRVDGANYYCAGPQRPHEVVRGAAVPRKGEWRYRALNLVSALDGAGRWECRVLPMFVDPGVACAAIEAVVRLSAEVASRFGGRVWVVTSQREWLEALFAQRRAAWHLGLGAWRALRALERGGGACV